MLTELSLSGRAGDQRIRGRVHAGFQRGGDLRLEGVAPFGAPIFILAALGERATLLLPREHRVLRDAYVADVLERLTGLKMSADDLRLVLGACVPDGIEPSEGRRWGGNWQAVRVDSDTTAFLRRVDGRVVIAAMDSGPWHADYGQFVGDWPRTVRIRRNGAGITVDITARIGELQVNTTIDPAAYTVAVPSDADPMTLDELRSVAPLAQKAPGP
jgi:hypothetical protein